MGGVVTGLGEAGRPDGPGRGSEERGQRAARVVGLEGKLTGSAVATGDDAETIAMVAMAIKA